MITTAESAESDHQNLIDALLTDQQRLTAVEKFAQRHQHAVAPLQEDRYRDLIPLTQPNQGQQYAFEVDLDDCSGCKACVAACHNLNGLEEEELWRDVGMLVGGSAEAPTMQHVTTACHHCIEPACLEGCPVDAYDKDLVTGIVRHLDDQCIGCQYCIFKCPYDVPKFSSSKGIVRKCDMCSDRLAVGEAPACVQSCPTQAIRIRVVDQSAALAAVESNQFLPGAPDPDYTIPTTVYKTSRSLPRNLLPGDYHTARPQHAHWPLVMMLVLTQLSVGAFVVEQLPAAWFGGVSVDQPWQPIRLIAALLLGFVGLGAAVLHLGRPLYAFRALMGLRKSWLSREILAFNLFAGAASAYVVAALLGDTVPAWLESGLGVAAAITGAAGVYCSAMIYIDTRRPFWNAMNTGVKFLLTSLLLGLPLSLLISLATAGWSSEHRLADVMQGSGAGMLRWLIVVSVCKLLFEASIFLHLRERRHSPLKRTALLLSGDLSMTVLRRCFFGVVGGVALPLTLLGESVLAPESGFHPLFLGMLAVFAFLLCGAGEVLERRLFFSAVVAPKMPGAA